MTSAFSLLSFYTSLGLDLNKSALQPEFNQSSERSKVVGLSVPDTAVTSATYHDYRTPIKLSSSGRLSQRRNLTETIPIKTYGVTTLLDGRQYREVVYQNETHSFDVPRVGSYLADRLYIKRLPPVQGVLTVDVNASEDKLVLPSNNRGFFPSPYLGSSMLESPPETVAWGLLAAVAAGEVNLVISIIKEFIYQAKLRSWYVGEDTLTVNTEPVWGFERFPVPLNPPVSNYILKEVAPNALLGLALVLAVKSLQEVYPIGCTLLYGARTRFQEELLISLKALATFCSYSISPITGYAAVSGEADAFNYDSPSLVSCYLVDLFLSHYLSIDYDFDIHVRGSRLHQVLLDSNKDVTADEYSGFLTRDFVNEYDPQDPAIVRSDPQAAVKYSQLNAAAYQTWWLLQFRPSISSSGFTRYESVKAAFTAATGVTNSKPDYLVSWLYHTQATAPNWVTTLDTQASELLNPATTYPLDLLATFLLKQRKFVPNPDTAFDFRSQAVSTLVETATQEIRRLWPYGSNWAGVGVEDDPKTVLGALLKAEAEVSYPWYVGYLVNQASIAPTTAIGKALREWVSLLFPQKLLASDAFLKQLLLGTLESRENLTSLFTVWGYNVVETTKTPRPYSAFISGCVADEYDSYTEATHSFMPDTPAEDYFNLAYRPSHGLSSSAAMLSSDSRSISTNLGLELRPVAGFPYRDLSLVDIEIESSAEIPLPVNPALRDRPRILAADYNPRNPQVYVVDGPVFIDPLANYVATKYITLDLPAASNLNKVLEQTQAAGIQLFLTAPKELNTSNAQPIFSSKGFSGFIDSNNKYSVATLYDWDSPLFGVGTTTEGPGGLVDGSVQIVYVNNDQGVCTKATGSYANLFFIGQLYTLSDISLGRTYPQIISDSIRTFSPAPYYNNPTGYLVRIELSP